MVEAAAKLLDEGGRVAVTLREVGRLTGVSHNAPYRHFANKDDLLGAIVGRELERLTVKGRAGSKGGRSTPAHLRLSGVGFGLSRPFPPCIRTMGGHQSGTAGLRDAMAGVADPFG